MDKLDFIIISQSEVLRYEDYSSMPLERIDLYRNLVQLRMVYYDSGFRSHLDMFNKALYNKYFHEASYEEKRRLFSIWNLSGLNGILAIGPLLNSGFNCKIINNFDAEFDLLIGYCKKMDPPIIGISTTFILQWSEIARLTKKIHKFIPEAIIVLGGAFISEQSLMHEPNYFEKPMRKYGIKYIIYSYNSEKDLCALIKAIKENRKNLSDVNNLVYIDSNDIFKTTLSLWNEPSLGPIKVLSNILNRNLTNKTIQMRTSSGCPFKCTFCSYPVTAKGFHPFDIEYIRLQLEEIKQLGWIEAIVFIDDNINVIPKRFRQILNLLKEYKFRWYAFYRVQYTDEAIARDMRESGCDGLYLGLESANDRVLQNMDKRARVLDYKQGIEVLKKYDIPLFAAFIIGFPGETEDTINDNVSFIEESSPDFYSLKEFYYIHTTPIHSRHAEFQLEGENNIWKHNTMNSIQASEMKLKIFESVRNSIHLDPDLGLWYLIYLRDKGFDWKRIRNCQNIINEMVRQDNSGKYNNKEQLFAKFTKNMQGL